MVDVNQLTNKLKEYVTTQVDIMSKSNPMVSFAKPLITRAVDKNFTKVKTALELIADENGNIDIEAILSEMIESVMTTEPFTFKTSYVGDIEIGGGLIKLNVPMTSKRLVFNQADLQSFREVLTAK